jgi:hypothetical protein
VLYTGDGDGEIGTSILLRASANRRFHHDGFHGHSLLYASEA